MAEDDKSLRSCASEVLKTLAQIQVDLDLHVSDFAAFKENDAKNHEKIDKQLQYHNSIIINVLKWCVVTLLVIVGILLIRYVLP